MNKESVKGAMDTTDAEKSCPVGMSVPGGPCGDASGYRSYARELVEQMTLEEKASLCSGHDMWTTKAVERLGILPICMTDGPHGLRKSTGMSAFDSVPTTCFPTSSALAATWNPQLAREVGASIAEECQENDVQILLAPSVNMKRSPLGGRNFEFFSEDPILAGELAAAFIQGVQSKGVGTSLKHFAANNQEFERFINNSVVDERTLREIYLPAFEIAIKKGQPWTVMCSYNRVNGVPASHNETLLDEILRRQWCFDGFVVSDWGAVSDRIAGIKAGLNLEMPSSNGITDREIVDAVLSGYLSEARLDKMVTELLSVILHAHKSRRLGTVYDREAHHFLARRVAAESIVLLKNDGGLLPLNLDAVKSIVVIGVMAKEPRYQGAGSSRVTPTRLDNAFDELLRVVGKSVRLEYVPGYKADGDTDEPMLAEARRVAARADLAIVFAGLPDGHESEGTDRTSLGLPDGHDHLICAVSSVQPRTIVTLLNGSAVTMPWIDQVPAVVEAWLCGQAGSAAIVDVLTGKVNPSGKLSESFPVRLEDSPAYPNFPGLDGEARYGEGVFIGYRYYDTKKIRPLFPFGHGLSYTTFDYLELDADATRVSDVSGTNVHVKVKNTGNRPGLEVTQLYVREQKSRVPRPEKELRHFAKTALHPGEEKTITFTLTLRDFSYWDVRIHDWAVNGGKFDLLVGGSSQDLPLSLTLDVLPSRTVFPPLTRDSLVKELAERPQTKHTYERLVKSMLQKLGVNEAPLDLSDQPDAQARVRKLFINWMRETPLSRILTWSNSPLTENELVEVIKRGNQQPDADGASRSVFVSHVR